MARLSEYKTLDEKADFFLNGDNRINTKEAFDEEVEKWLNHDSFGMAPIKNWVENKWCRDAVPNIVQRLHFQRMG